MGCWEGRHGVLGGEAWGLGWVGGHGVLGWVGGHGVCVACGNTSYAKRERVDSSFLYLFFLYISSQTLAFINVESSV